MITATASAASPPPSSAPRSPRCSSRSPCRRSCPPRATSATSSACSSRSPPWPPPPASRCSPARAPAPPPDPAAALATARQVLPDALHYRLSAHHAGDAAAWIDVRGWAHDGLHHFASVRAARDGALLHVGQPGGPGATSKTLEAAYLLHSGLYGGYGVRLLYALLALFGALTILSGNLIWLERRARNRRRVDVFIARLTSGGCAGAAAALAAIFLANQLLPEALADRVAWEQRVFWGAWLASVGYALVFPRATASAVHLLALSGLTFLLLPALDGALNARLPLAPTGNPYLFWTDLALVALGALLLAGAHFVRRLVARRLASAPAEPLPAAA